MLSSEVGHLKSLTLNDMIAGSAIVAAELEVF
jgi:hypothetical protein